MNLLALQFPLLVALLVILVITLKPWRMDAGAGMIINATAYVLFLISGAVAYASLRGMVGYEKYALWFLLIFPVLAYAIARLADRRHHEPSPVPRIERSLSLIAGLFVLLVFVYGVYMQMDVLFHPVRSFPGPVMFILRLSGAVFLVMSVCVAARFAFPQSSVVRQMQAQRFVPVLYWLYAGTAAVAFVGVCVVLLAFSS